jgi:hypothetical protein
LAFLVIDFRTGPVGPIDPHWLHLAAAVELPIAFSPPAMPIELGSINTITASLTQIYPAAVIANSLLTVVLGFATAAIVVIAATRCRLGYPPQRQLDHLASDRATGR